tara:strand:+ start:381 stop:1631 length:1251 start_codon:yes stop_codon:yes gene_type:complete
MDSPDLWQLILFVVFLILSAFFSSSETAFIALPRAHLMHLANTGNSRAKLAARLMERPEKLLATVLLSNNLVNTAAAALGTAIAISLIQNPNIAILVSTVGVTTLLLVFSETLPKTVAWKRSEQVAFTFARPLALVGWLLYPAIQVLQGITILFTKLIGIDSAEARSSEQEIRTLIMVGAQTGDVEASEATLLEKVFRFGDQRVMDVMTPRPQIVWVRQGTTVNQFLDMYCEHRHTRFPVYEDTIENVTGVFSVKDVLFAIGKGLGPDDEVTNFQRPALFVPETKPVRDTFSEMQNGGHGIVLAIDEFGGIAGLATLEQLLEIIVGDVTDERSEELYTEVSDNIYSLDARVGIGKVNDELSLNLPEGSYKTVAGFMLERLGDIPSEGDSVQYQNLTLTVTAMSGVRIVRVEAVRMT